MNLLGIIVSYLYIGIVIIGAKIFNKKGIEFSRKFIHIMLGNWWFIAMYFFTNVWFAMFVPVTFVIINYVSYKKNLIKVMEREENDGIGTVYYAIALLILTVVSFGIYKEPLLGLIPTLTMAYGDGFAAVFGKLIKSKKYKISGAKKSYAGSLTMFFITTLLIGGYLVLKYNQVFWQTAHWPLITVMMAYCITGIEAVSSKGLDNITVPISTLLMLILIQ